MQNSWLVLLPPILVLLSAFITKKVVPSLVLGIVSGAIIAADFSPLGTLQIIYNHLLNQVERSNIYTFIFLLLLGMIIALISHSGGTQAYGDFIKKKLRSARSAESASLLLSLCFMIDDFFSSITVGCIMRPISDSFHIPRVKLAYLIDSLAAPLVILVPVSSWIAMIIAQLEKGGISKNISEHPLILAEPFWIYLQAIPFVFYSLITFCALIFIVQKRISFGPMRKHEQIAQETGNLFGGKPPLKNALKESPHVTGSIIDFVIPIATLIASVFMSLLYTGEYWLFGGNHTLVQALQQPGIIFLSLLLGGIITVLFSLVFYSLRSKITVQDLPDITRSGFDLMWGSILILLLAWTFSSLLLIDLKTGDYLAQLIMGTMHISLLPMLIFIISTAISIGIGSSWGTIAIMTPLAIPMVVKFMLLNPPVSPEQIPLLLPVIGALFSGAVTGDHLSPLAGTTVMSATSAGAYLPDHVETQFIMAIPMLIATIISFLIAGQLSTYPSLFNASISLLIGVIICYILLYVLQKKLSKNNI